MHSSHGDQSVHRHLEYLESISRGVDGWDLRVTNVLGAGIPKMVVMKVFFGPPCNPRLERLSRQ